MLSRTTCKDGTKLKEAIQGKHESDDEVEVFRWQKVTVDDRLKKVKLIMSIDDAVESIFDTLPGFLRHVYMKMCLEVAYQQDIEESSAAKCVGQIDFAENYTCVFQDEFHTAHWNQKQLTVFTACVWKGPKNITSYAVTADSTVHDRRTALAYLHEVLLAAEIDGSTQSLNIWPDGSSSQFKNRYIANCLPPMNVAYHCQTSWNFFATSHRKGPVDGMGGAVKRAVRDMVRCRRAIVIDVPTFIAAYRASCGAINILTCEAPSECLLRSHVMSPHRLAWGCAENVLKMATTSTATSTTTLTPSSTDTTSVLSASDSIHKGNFVVVRVHRVKAGSERNYVALATMTSGDETSVVYLNRSGRKFSIVDPKEWLVDKVDILRVLAQPSLDNRDRYDFGEIDF